MNPFVNQLGFQCADVFAVRFMQKVGIVIADGNAILTRITEMCNHVRADEEEYEGVGTHHIPTPSQTWGRKPD